LSDCYGLKENLKSENQPKRNYRDFRLLVSVGRTLTTFRKETRNVKVCGVHGGGEW